MRCLVTGATGFIGSHLCRRLAADGHAVTALVRSPAKATELTSLGVESLAGDLSLFADAALELPECDVVFHLAATINAPSLDQYEAINFRAVVDLAACLERQSWSPKRLVFASSQAAVGPSGPGQAHTEEDPTAPVDAYGDAKARAEEHLRGASFPVTCVRPPVVFGKGDPAFLTLFKMAKLRLGFRVAGSRQRISYVYIDDLIDALVLVAADDRPGWRVYFTARPDAVDTDQLWAELGRAVGKRGLVLPVPKLALKALTRAATAASRRFGFFNQLDEKQYQQMVAPAFVCSSERIRAELGWRPRVGFAEAVTLTGRGYRELGWL